MAISIPRLRIWFAIIAIATVMAVAGFYFYARYRVRTAIRSIPGKLGIEVQQSTDNFSLSKSEGGHTLFTIKASKAVQYKQGGQAQLKDVSIIVYGRNSERFDQIYGSSFAYDPKEGTISAQGDVMIDLQANGDATKSPDQSTPKELKNPIHLKTSGLVFNQKTGIAQTKESIEFRIPQASGSAVGAIYDSKANQLKLTSDVIMQTTGDRGATIKARSAAITKDPQVIALESVSVTQKTADFDANHVDVYVRNDNTIDHVVATGDVHMRRASADAFSLAAPRADLKVGAKNQVESAQFTGGVKFEGTGKNAMNGTAGRIDLQFGSDSRLRTVHASNDVHLLQLPGSSRSSQTAEITAPALDLFARNGRAIDHAETRGASQIVMTGAQTAVASPAKSHAGERTTATADRFIADFAKGNRIRTVRGEHNARLVFSIPGEPDKVSTSANMLLQFAPGGGIQTLTQDGGVDYRQAANAKLPEQHATADRAVYSADDDTLSLSGNPHVTDGGTTISSQQLRLNRRTGDAFATGNVKTTYNEVKATPTGALLATAEPIHVTAKNMNAQRQSGIARYTGGARLWQGANIVEAPTIEFDRLQKSIVASGAATDHVSSVFVQVDASGKSTPMVVTASELTYVDADHRARYSGGVVAKGADATVTADEVDVILASAANRQPGMPGPSQLQQIVATSHVVIQGNGRRATGDRLVYSADSGKFVLTGGPPVITDPERGFIKGDSLTFYSRDDRVLVESAGTQRTVTHTKINQQ